MTEIPAEESAGREQFLGDSQAASQTMGILQGSKGERDNLRILGI